MVLSSNLLRDKELIEEVLDRSSEIIESRNLNELFAELTDENSQPSFSLTDVSLETPLISIDEIRRYIDISVKESPGAVANSFQETQAIILEAIIEGTARPAILIQNNSIDVDTIGQTDPDSRVWKDRISPSLTNIKRIIPAVGRIELRNHTRGLIHAGTGWLVADDTIVTNQHVAREFARRDGENYTFKVSQTSNDPVGVDIDFREEYLIGNEEVFKIREVLYIEPDDGPDIAFLRVSRNRIGLQGEEDIVPLTATPIPLQKGAIDPTSWVASIGYPADDNRRLDIRREIVLQIFGNIFDVKRFQPGEITTIDYERNLITHDCSTLGGNSGSVLIDLKSGQAIGLHFGYALPPTNKNVAVSAQIIRDRLNRLSGGIRTESFPEIFQTPNTKHGGYTQMNENTQNLEGLFPIPPAQLEGLVLPETPAGGDEYSIILETICGTTDDSEPVEQYSGRLGVPIDFVNRHQSAVCQVQWKNNLEDIYQNPGDVSGVRWGTGTMISSDIMITCGHLFDSSANGWTVPRINGSRNPIPPEEIALNMQVNFNYQIDPSGNLRRQVSFDIQELIEYREAGLDMAICRIKGNPGAAFGITSVSSIDATEGEMLCIMGHPSGRPKRIEAGPATSISGNLIRYNDIDTLGGNSGSGILSLNSGKIVGIHTNGGCDVNSPSGLGGSNYGLRITRFIAASPTLQNIIRNEENDRNGALNNDRNGGLNEDKYETALNLLREAIQQLEHLNSHRR